MPLMLLSNPLPMAVLGNPRRSRKPRGIKRGAYRAAVRRAKKRVRHTFKTRGRGRYQIKSFRGTLIRRARRHLAGIPWSGRRGYLSFTARTRRAGSRSYSTPHALTNPRNRTMSRRRRHTSRRNPGAIASYISAAKAAPSQVMSTFTGPNKVKHILFAAGGAAATYLVGGILASKVVAPVLSRIPVVSGVVGSPMGQRIVGGLIPFTVGFIAAKFVKNPDIKRAIIVGGAAASILELVKPGMVGQLIAKVPGASMVAAAAPAVAAPALKGPTSGLDGLSGYVSAPAYAGVGDGDALAGYVSAPAYAGVGDADDALAGYVSAPAYAGVGDEDGSELDGAEDVMAGVDGYIEQSQDGYKSYLAN